MRLPFGAEAKERRVSVALGVMLVSAAAARIAISVLSIGSDDARLWRDFGKSIYTSGLIQTYIDRADFNHPPLPAIWGWLSYAISHAFQLRFAELFKVPIIASDALSAWLLWKIWRQRGNAVGAPLVLPFLHAFPSSNSADRAACMGHSA
jgi:hypothetical protein